MPVFRTNSTFNLARLRAFLKLEAGVGRDAGGAPGGSPNGTAGSSGVEQELQTARKRIERQSRLLERKDEEISDLKRNSNWRYGLTAGRLPDFIIIGGRKCGTSLLYHILTQHPQVESAVKKEVHYFDLHYYWGDDWYRAHFPPTTEADGRRVVTGEGSPYYLTHPHAARRMAKLVPGAKLIALLREPVSRAYSHYQHEVRRFREPLDTFEEGIAAEEGRLSGELEAMQRRENYISANHAHFSYLSRGIYVDQLKHYEKFFSRDQMLVLKSEDLFENTQELLGNVLDFLELPPWDLEGPTPRVNSGKYEPINPETRERLRRYYEPHNQRLYEYLGRDLGW
ncbi:Sulfotransferase domain [Rubrobacter radiotolerans]|uniref:Sulfotransferase domain n=1 Tax=Rubrobacter radiotolerans TaxID=42256 RepID=A0A023X6A2_RUBRA|nr:sulfotransferase domain-containing protein [Rubrobacter radiotolerans]AHY47992.1 Sulfotransferase domain [Rubrobacter radiotolerans]MDX5892631.1 sulfotransferase domain-containing protein [Rubrobacter radiotolerans]SMC07963.1 Sulfotransferase domain-containing protein [Rubrobacter radiotolerans DSM 5868]